MKYMKKVVAAGRYKTENIWVVVYRYIYSRYGGRNGRMVENWQRQWYTYIQVQGIKGTYVEEDIVVVEGGRCRKKI